MLSVSLTKLRNLNLPAPINEGRFAHVSAASGLVCINSIAYVIADDELHLGVFRTDSSDSGYMIPIFPGLLPEGKSDRKKQKPDFEALTLLPASEDYPYGALLALGSGSRLNRRAGVVLSLNAKGVADGVPRAVDLSPVFASLDYHFYALNIEGAFVSGNELRLLQRGNSKHGENAVIRFQLADFLDVLFSKRVGTIKPLAIHAVDLGRVNGISLAFTDGAALPNGGMVFTAVAEHTDDPYDDGLCAGAAIGVADSNFQLRWLRRLEPPYKVEGIDAQVEGDAVRLLIVTDADEVKIPASLFSTTIQIESGQAPDATSSIP